MIRRFNAVDGKEIWAVEIGAAKEEGAAAGVKASPAVGQYELRDLVFFTVTGLDAEGRNTLGLGEDAKAAVIALEKDTGAVRWAAPLGAQSESSPAAVYDEGGNGWIIQCEGDGTVLLLEGRTGKQVSALQLGGRIQGSPAVYGDILTVCTEGEEGSFACGIRIH